MSKASVQGAIEEALLPIRRLFETLQDALVEIRTRLDALEADEPEPEPEPQPEPEPEPGPGEPGAPQEPEEPAPFRGFDLAVNPAFTDANRRLKDGTPFTEVMSDIYDGLLRFYLNGEHLRDGNESLVEVERLLAEGDSYQVGRTAFRQIECLLIFFRLTGDARLLDELCRLAKVAYGKGMRTTWHPGAPILDPSHAYHREPHGERFFPWLLIEGSERSRHWGADSHLMDTMRALRPFTQIGEALRVNRDASSPAGHDYKTEAEKWRRVLDGYERVWSNVDDSLWPSNVKVPSTYKGFYEVGGGYRRADLNEWPVNFRSIGHPAHGAGLMSIYMGRLLGKEAVGLAGAKRVLDPHFEEEVLYATVGGREHAFYQHGYYTMNSNQDFAAPSTYAEYDALDFVDLHLDGALNGDHDTARFLRGFANSVSFWVLDGNSPSAFTMKGDIQGSRDRTGVSISGRTGTIKGAAYKDQSREIASQWALCVLAPWADDDGKLREYASASFLQYRSNGQRDWSQPEVLTVPLGVFMDEAGLGRAA